MRSASFIVGLVEHPTDGWIDGTAIVIAILLVAFVTATNNYKKELQFRALRQVEPCIGDYSMLKLTSIVDERSLPVRETVDTFKLYRRLWPCPTAYSRMLTTWCGCE